MPLLVLQDPAPPCWSSAKARLGGLVLGTAVAAVLGGFAAVNFPLDVVREGPALLCC